MKASSDTTTHTRVIVLEDGPIVPEGSGLSRSRYQVKVTRLELRWTDDALPTFVFAAGHRVLKSGELGVAAGHATYALNGGKWDQPAPPWVLDLINTNHR